MSPQGVDRFAPGAPPLEVLPSNLSVGIGMSCHHCDFLRTYLTARFYGGSRDSLVEFRSIVSSTTATSAMVVQNRKARCMLRTFGESLLGGADTIRGISYQNACAIGAALDVVADPRFAALRLESSAEIIDFELLDSRQHRLRAAQAKSRIEPYTISVDDLLGVFRQWAALPGAADSFQLFSNSQLNQPASLLKQQLDELQSAHAEGTPSKPAIGPLLQFSEDLLRRIRIHTRYGDTLTLLDQAELRLLRLADKRLAPSDAGRHINDLWKAFSIRGGSRNATERTFYREELATILGIDLESLESRSPWTTRLADEYRLRLASVETPFLILTATRRDNVPPALLLTARHTDTGDPIPVVSILSIYSRCALEGASGSGKSTTLGLLNQHLAKSGELPMLITPNRYVAGSLAQLIQEALEVTLKRTLVADAAEMAVRDPAAVLLVDGFTERSLEERNELRRDLRVLTTCAPNLRVLVAGRSPGDFRLPEYPLLSLEPLTHQGRVTLANSLLPTDMAVDATVEKLEHLLGDLIGNPLMFVMALSLDCAGIAVSTRASIYRDMVDGLWHRQLDEELDQLATEVLARNAGALVEAEAFRASPHHWSSLTTDSLAAIPSRGDAVHTPEQLSDVLRGVGLIVVPDFNRTVCFLHDSFRDYFASLSYRPSSVGLPALIRSSHENSLRFFCEEHGFSTTLALQASQQNPVACYRLAHYEAFERDAELARNILRNLLPYVGSKATNLGDKVGVKICWTNEQSWISVTRDGLARVVASLSELATGEPPLLIYSRQGHLGPVLLATRAWRHIAESTILETAHDSVYWHSDSIRTPTQLRDLLVQHASERQAAITTIVETSLPQLSDRILKEVGPTGLHAIISPRPGDFQQHAIRYRYEDGPHLIEVHDSQERDLTPWSFTTAQYLLEQSPTKSASQAVLNSFGGLLDSTL